MNYFQAYLTLEQILGLCSLVDEQLKHTLVSKASLSKEVLEEAKKNLSLAIPHTHSPPLGKSVEIDVEQLKGDMEENFFFMKTPPPLPGSDEKIKILENRLADRQAKLLETQSQVKDLEESVKGFEAWQRREQKERVESYNVGDTVEFTQTQPDGISDVKIIEVIISRQNSIDYRLQWWSLRGELTEVRVHSSLVRRIDTDILPLPGSNPLL